MSRGFLPGSIAGLPRVREREHTLPDEFASGMDLQRLVVESMSG